MYVKNFFRNTSLLIIGPGLLMLTSLGCHSSKDTQFYAGEAEGWEWVKAEKTEAPSWRIFRRELTGTTFVEYKIEGDIASSPEAAMASFRRDIQQQAADTANRKYPTYDLLEASEQSLLTYVIHNEPFPLKDTEMCIRYTFSQDEAGNEGVTWREAWDESQVEASKKLNRVETFRGSWTFSSAGNGGFKAVNTVQFDPKNMPRALAEPMVVKFLKNGLQDIQEMTSQ